MRLGAAEAQNRRFSYTQSAEQRLLRSRRGDRLLCDARLHQRVVGCAGHLQLLSQRYVVMVSEVGSWGKEKSRMSTFFHSFRAIIVTSVPVSFFLQKLFDFLGEMPLPAPHEANHRQHHEDCYQSQPERLLQHALRQRSLRNLHSSVALRPLEPSVASGIVLFRAQRRRLSFNTGLCCTCTRSRRSSRCTRPCPRRDCRGTASPVGHKLILCIRSDTNTAERKEKDKLFHHATGGGESNRLRPTLNPVFVSSQCPKTHGSISHIVSPQKRPV